MSFLEMSIMGGVMALAIAALRAVFLNKLPKRTFVFLWEAAMLRLLLPLSVPAAASVYTLFAKPQTHPSGRPVITVRNAPAAADAASFQAAAKPLQENFSSASVPAQTVIWLAGAAIAFSVFVLGYVLVYRKYRYAEAIKDGYPALWLSKQRLVRKVGIYRSGQTLSPLTYGIIRPVILLPENVNMESPKQLDFILTHELTHIRRFDALRKLIAAAVLCLHWFNPAVWVLFLLYNRDIELACDEAVVRKEKGDCRSAYAMTLIDMEERQRGFSSLVNYFSRNAAEERIVAIMKTKKISIFTSIAACVLAVGVICTFATSAAADEKSQKADNEVSGVDAIMISNDETIAMDDDILEQTKNGVKVPKSVDGEKNIMLTKSVPISSTNNFTVKEEKPKAVVSKESMTAWYDSQRDKKAPVVYGREWVKQYGSFGITLDENGYLLYDGEKVRYFLDGITTANGSMTFLYYYENPEGTADVHAERELEYNSEGTRIGFGKILLVEKSSPEQFAAKEIPFGIWGDLAIKPDGGEKPGEK